MALVLKYVSSLLAGVAVTLYLVAGCIGLLAWRIEESPVFARASRYAVVVVLFVLGLLVMVTSCTTTNSTGFSIRPEILQSFRQIQQEFTIETARCLLGTVKDDGHVEVTGVYPPTILESSVSRVRFSRCPAGTVGWWHSHPRASCALSPTDMKTGDNVFNRFLLTLVSCSPDLFIYRFRGEERQHRLEIVRGGQT